MRVRDGSWLFLPVLLLAGCQTAKFYSQAVSGQAEILVKRRAFDRVTEGTTDAELKERLALTRRVLDFAHDEMEMPSNGSFELYADVEREHLVWVLYAAPELSLEPKDWWYPVVGRQDYRGFFREDMARTEAERLEAAGYETWINEVDAISTLGFFRDPVLNTFVKREEAGYVELIFHELCHQKHYVRGNTPFSEGLAEAVARDGVIRWFRATDRPDMVKKYEAMLGRLELARAAIEGTAKRLDDIYQSDLPDAQKRNAKARELSHLKRQLRKLRAKWNRGLKSWIEEPINNARLVSFTTYETEVRRFTTLLEECGGGYAEFWRRVKDLDDGN
jgi:predicted aminopeptidase